MIIIKFSKDLKDYLKKRILPRKFIGFVPTMGALHEGHLSLVKECRKMSQISICSIFVNPTQFNNPDDFKRYPKTIEKDILWLEEAGCDILFMPDEKEIYFNKKLREKHYELGYLETILEGKFRPGHFQGVCQVVERLLNIVEPDYLFIGQKDFQQCLVIKRLLELNHKKIELVICPTLRENSGLAMSSRNLRFNLKERKIASELNRCLLAIKDKLTKNNFPNLKYQAVLQLEKTGFRVEYLELAKRNNLEIVTQFKKGEELVILVAAFLNEVRLIDNLLIKG
ncbi:MAG TPA: pantoate--beta-alanine ligase [Hanamia sp.]|nr:pantoate--beta-alanine ligase [Hanamia sp.]